MRKSYNNLRDEHRVDCFASTPTSFTVYVISYITQQRQGESSLQLLSMFPCFTDRLQVQLFLLSRFVSIRWLVRGWVTVCKHQVNHLAI